MVRAMKRDNWPVEDEGIRPAVRGPNHCTYCGEPKGSTHKPDCVVRERTVVVRMTVEYVRTVPESWDNETVETVMNETSWCSSNALQELESLDERADCLCEYTQFEFVREATEEDEERNKLYVKDLAS